MVCDEMVYVVTTLPPAHREATTKVRNEHSDQCVYYEVMGDSLVPGIVSGEHDLVLIQVSRASVCLDII